MKAQSVQNPLTLFPSKRPDSTVKAHFSRSLPSLRRKQIVTSDWLLPSAVDPSFGIQESSGSISSLRRTFRRIESSNVFVPPQPTDALLSDIADESSTKRRNLVLVEASRVSDFLAVENVLRQEKKRLEDQCLIVTGTSCEFKTSPNVPVPATRMAVHSACESEMQLLAGEIKSLNEKWTQFCKLNRYERDPRSAIAATLQSVPLSFRISKLQQLQVDAESWWLAKERDTMMYEDDVSRLVDRYVKAKLRKADYDRYYVLATRYGIWSEDKFYADSTPGKRYFRAVTNGAVGLQRLFRNFWARAIRLRYNAAVRIQTAFRCHFRYRTLNPIIRLRLRVGRRAMFFFCWERWQEYLRMVREMRDIVQFWLVTSDRKCFNAWRMFTQQCKQEKENILRRFILRMKNMELAGIYLSWVHWTKKRKRTKLFLRRLFRCPQFELWIDYVKMNKLRRELSRQAVKIQALARGYIERCKYLEMKRAVRKLEHFGLLVLAKANVRRRRDLVFDEGFAKWKAGEVARLADKATENERRRLIRQQAAVQEAELKYVTDLRKHLRTHDGSLQLSELAEDIKQGLYNPTEVPDTVHLSPTDALRDVATKELLKQCKRIARGLERHEFNVKSPPLFKCADPRCAAVFTSLEQYHTHVKMDTLHSTERCLLPKWLFATALQKSAASSLESLSPAVKSSKSGKMQSRKDSRVRRAHSVSKHELACEEILASDKHLFSHLHFQLRHREAHKFVKEYLQRVYELSGDDNEQQHQSINQRIGCGLMHCYELYVALQDIRRISMHVDNKYYSRVGTILDTFLRDGCPKHLPFNDPVLQFCVGADSVTSNNSCTIEGSKAAPSLKEIPNQSGFIRSIRGIKEVSSRMLLQPSAIGVQRTASDDIGGGSNKVNKAPQRMLNSSMRALSMSAALVSPLLRMNSNAKPQADPSPLEGEDERSAFMIAEDSLVGDAISTAVATVDTAIHLQSQGRRSAGGVALISSRAKRGLWRRLLQMESEPFEKWTLSHQVSPDVFDQIEWFCFRRLYVALLSDLTYTTSREFLAYQQILIDDAHTREHTLRRDYANHCKVELQKWTSQFKFVEMAISRRAEDVLSKYLGRRLYSLLTVEYIETVAEEIVARQSTEEQHLHEALRMVQDEAVDWVLFNVCEEVYENYAHTLIAQMWEQPNLRRSLLTFAGIVEEKFKKKLFVNMETSTRAQQAAFKQFIDADYGNNTAPKDTLSSLL